MIFVSNSDTALHSKEEPTGSETADREGTAEDEFVSPALAPPTHLSVTAPTQTAGQVCVRPGQGCAGEPYYVQTRQTQGPYGRGHHLQVSRISI